MTSRHAAIYAALVADPDLDSEPIAPPIERFGGEEDRAQVVDELTQPVARRLERLDALYAALTGESLDELAAAEVEAPSPTDPDADADTPSSDGDPAAAIAALFS